MAFTYEDLQNLDAEDLKRIGIAPLPVRIGVLAFMVIAICIGGYMHFISPQFEEIDQHKREEMDLKNTFAKESRKAANLDAYTQQLDEMNRSFGAMLRMLPDKTEVESLLVDLSQTSAANNLKVGNFKPTGEVTKEFYAEYPIALTVSGKYHELAKFVSDVAALPRIVTLHDITISAEDAKFPTDLTMKMVAKTYRYLDDEDESEAP